MRKKTTTAVAAGDGGKLPSRKAFMAFERVRKRRNWNMLMPQAIAASGLDRATYMAMIKNYEALMKKYPDVRR